MLLKNGNLKSSGQNLSSTNYMSFINKILNLPTLNSDKDDIVLSRGVAAYFLFVTLNSAIKNIFRIQVDNSFAGFITIACIGAMLFYIFHGMRYVYKRIPTLTKQIYFLFIFIYLFSAFLSILRNEPLNLLLFGTAPNTFIFFLPVGLCACSIRNIEVLYNLLLKWSFIASFVLLLSFIFREQVNDYGVARYDMTFGLSMILPTLLHINHYRKSKSRLLFLFCIVEILSLLIYANRSVLLSLGFYFIGIYFYSFKKLVTKVFALILLALIALIFLCFYKYFVDILSNIIDQTGVQSRTLLMLVNENLAESNERLELWEICKNMIEKKPFLGWGIGGEYFEIAKQYGDSMKEASIYHNPHNALLQCFVNFGIIGGGIACLFCVRPIFQLNKIKNPVTFELVLIFVSVGIIPKLVSAAGFFVNPNVAVALFLFYKSIYWTRDEKKVIILS